MTTEKQREKWRRQQRSWRARRSPEQIAETQEYQRNYHKRRMAEMIPTEKREYLDRQNALQRQRRAIKRAARN